MAFVQPQSLLRRGLAALIVALLASVVWVSPVRGQDRGTVASAVLVTENSITIDGQLDDWENIPATVTVDGPQPSPNPGATGRLRWQVAADPTTIFFAATITDEVIVGGQDGGNYWNEDSFEFYLNLSNDLAATTYGDGISQIRISAVDIGLNDPAALTVTGIGLDQHEINGFVFATSDGWGTEFAVDVAGLYQPAEGQRFGLQVQANGSSGGDRDLKLSWSAADMSDTSFEDPSVFGQGVFIGALATESSAVTDPPAPESGEVDNDAADGGAQPVESIAEDGPEVVTADEQRRSLFIAAIVSSLAVFLGGLWFERKRRADEKRHVEERQAAAREKGLPVAASAEPAVAADAAREVDAEADTDVDLETKEFEAMLDSILDDDAPTDGYE